LKKREWITGIIVLAVLAALIVWVRAKIHFDFHLFAAQAAQADWRKILFGIACIYTAYLFRSARWSLLMRRGKHVPLFSLTGTQVIGFTAVALIGRVADPVRPYLVARKTGQPLSAQIAVYIVERLMDAGSMALIFSVAMIGVPAETILGAATAKSGALAHLAPHHRLLALFVARYGGLVLTVLGAAFLFAVRLSGGAVATFFERSFGLISKNLGLSIGHKIRQFRSGLDTMRNFADFAAVTAISLSMWVLISLSYFLTCQAFVASPGLSSITASQCVLLMVASGTASIIQLPIIGWFSQIGLVAVALVGILHAETEAATACAATLLLVTFLSVIPVGLIWAQFEHISLRKVALESEQAADGEDSEAN
jgi:uncharacterized membrane protein YbhN (UPF0104 family)